MSFDFALLLVALTLGSALICLVDACFFARRRKQAAQSAPRRTDKATAGGDKRPLFVEYARSLFPIFLVVLLLRSFLFEPFRIPSASMMPTLLIGDFILVNKFVYGVRLPVLDTLVREGGAPEKGDVVVFRYPLDTSVSYIKRVVGLPGDYVVYHDHALFVNGEPVRQEVRGAYTAYGAGMPMDGVEVRSEFLVETRHDILISQRDLGQRFETRVPAGHYFVLGDNRDHSRDSRFWGFVPEQNMIGQACLIWMSWDWKNWRNGFVAFSRIGNDVI